MSKVKKELQFLKSKAQKAAGELSNDDTITNLQQSIKWFQSEAIELDKILEGQKKEVQKLKTQKLNTRDDNKFLKTQVKDAMKHNKLLEVAHKKTSKQCNALKHFLERNKKTEQLEFSGFVDQIGQQQLNSQKQEPNMIEDQTSNDGESQNLQAIAEDLGASADFVAQIERFSKDESSKERKKIEDELDDKEVVANLQIVGDNGFDSQGTRDVLVHEQAKTFFTSLPQTQEELEQLSIDSADYQI